MMKELFLEILNSPEESDLDVGFKILDLCLSDHCALDPRWGLSIETIDALPGIVLVAQVHDWEKPRPSTDIYSEKRLARLGAKVRRDVARIVERWGLENAPWDRYADRLIYDIGVEKCRWGPAYKKEADSC